MARTNPSDMSPFSLSHLMSSFCLSFLYSKTLIHLPYFTIILRGSCASNSEYSWYKASSKRSSRFVDLRLVLFGLGKGTSLSNPAWGEDVRSHLVELFKRAAIHAWGLLHKSSSSTCSQRSAYLNSVLWGFFFLDPRRQGAFSALGWRRVSEHHSGSNTQ